MTTLPTSKFCPTGANLARWNCIRADLACCAFSIINRIGDGAAHVLVQPGDAVDTPGAGHAVVVDDVERVALQQHG